MFIFSSFFPSLSLELTFIWLSYNCHFLLLTYLHSRVVAALLHMQQSAGLAPCPELDLQAAGTGGVRGHALQRLSQKDVTFRALLHWVVQTAGAIQGQGGVCCHVCQGKRISSVLSDFTAISQTTVKPLFPLRSWRAQIIFLIQLPWPQIGSYILTSG